MPTAIPPLTDGTFFHIYNRGNNRENIFIQERNYAYFMELWWKHINPIAETWAYCLLRNHFHAAVFIKDKEDLATNLTGLEDLSGFKNTIKEPSRYCSNFFNAYARGINIATERTGALFERPFKRIPIDRGSHLLRLIVYIHQNPQKHHFVNDFRDWKYSSYHEHTLDAPTRLQRDSVLQVFRKCLIRWACKRFHHGAHRDHGENLLEKSPPSRTGVPPLLTARTVWTPCSLW